MMEASSGSPVATQTGARGATRLPVCRWPATGSEQLRSRIGSERTLRARARRCLLNQHDFGKNIPGCTHSAAPTAFYCAVSLRGAAYSPLVASAAVRQLVKPVRGICATRASMFLRALLARANRSTSLVGRPLRSFPALKKRADFTHETYTARPDAGSPAPVRFRGCAHRLVTARNSASIASRAA